MVVYCRVLIAAIVSASQSNSCAHRCIILLVAPYVYLASFSVLGDGPVEYHSPSAGAMKLFVEFRFDSRMTVVSLRFGQRISVLNKNK